MTQHDRSARNVSTATLVATLVAAVATIALAIAAPAAARAQGLFDRVGLRVGPGWAAAPASGSHPDGRYADRVGSVLLTMEAGVFPALDAVLEVGYTERSGPVLYGYTVTPDGPVTTVTAGTARYRFGTFAPLARLRLLDGPVRLYGLAGPRAHVDLGGNPAGAQNLMVELTAGAGVELPARYPVFLEARGSLGVTDLSVRDDGIRTRALELLVGVGAVDRPAGAVPGFFRRVSLKSGVTWGTTAARPLEASASGRILSPFWSGLLAVETRELAGPVAAVLELGFVQRGYARDRYPYQAYKDAAVSAAILGRAGLLGGGAGDLYAVAGPRLNVMDRSGGRRFELTGGLGFALAALPFFVEARASASLTDAYPDDVPLWLRDEPGSWDRALDLLIGVVLVEP